MIDLEGAQNLHDQAQAKLTSFIPVEVRAAISLLGFAIEELRDARTALAAPELHWECKQREEKLEEELRSARDRIDQVADTMNYSLPGGRRT